MAMIKSVMATTDLAMAMISSVMALIGFDYGDDYIVHALL